MLREHLEKVLSGKNLHPGEMTEAMDAIMDGLEPEVLVGAFLAGLRAKGETIGEIASAASVMRGKAQPVRVPSKRLLDIVGTGGDRTGTINISSAASLVASAAGSAVAKHGNRSVSSRCGSADLLEAMGVPLFSDPADVETCIRETGYGFIFAPHFHRAMKNVAPVRKTLGLRTIFNILGPLTNPACPSRQLIGTFSAGLVRPMAEVLERLGSERALVVHGHGGMDELSLDGPNRACLLDRGTVTEMEILPEDAGLDRAHPGYAAGGDAAQNRQAILRIFQGEKGPMRDVVVFNAGAALFVDGLASSLFEGARAAEGVIDGGQALRKLDEVAAFAASRQAVVA